MSEYTEQIAALGYALEQTPLLNATMCARCAYGMVYRRKEGADQVSVYCKQVHHEMPPDVIECTQYTERNRMELYDMQQIALSVDPRKGVDDKSYI